MNYSAFGQFPFISCLKRVAAALSALLAFCAVATAEDEESEKPEGIAEKEGIAQKTEDHIFSEGLFDIYQDPESGTAFMVVDEADLGREFISFSYSENGVLEAGHFRGAYRDNRVLKFERKYDRLQLINVNTRFHFDEDKAVSRASEANISPAILAAPKIITTDESDDGDRYLINIDQIFLGEGLHKVGPGNRGGRTSSRSIIGGLAPDRTGYKEIRNYPENTNVIIDYTFSNPDAAFGGSDAITDPRAVTVTMQHSFIAMPDEEFVPRKDDYRIGYFFEKVTDLTSADAAPYRDLINRWRLEKKDPDAALSDPVKPITWWIENTTPHKYRDTIRDAALAWNKAFEKAGFTNAIRVEVQPDDAQWDAGDIRYNVLRWTSSPIPPFGGYGPNFSNPRTGEILGADVMLEYSFLTNRAALGDVFPANPEQLYETLSRPTAAKTWHHDNADREHSLPELTPATGHKHGACTMAAHMTAQNAFGIAALKATGASEDEIDALVREAIYFLILHEIGHTLGLNHNMKASSLYDPLAVHDREITQGAPTGSVMDYPAVNIAPTGLTQGDYYNQRPGHYDDWAIEFGYSPAMEDADARTMLLARSTEPGNAFGNDADDMRRSGSGIDPRVMIGDMSSDPVAYGRDRMDLVTTTLASLVDKYDEENSWQELVRAYRVALSQRGTMARIMARQIGGVYVDRRAPSQSTDTNRPYTPVPEETQKAAMRALADYVFAENALGVPPELASRLQRQRRGFEFFFAGNEDPKLHSQTFAIQQSVLSQLLHPATLQRLTDTQAYGNTYSSYEMLSDLTDAIFGNDLVGTPSTFRKNLQIAYVERLRFLVDASIEPNSRTAALAALQKIRLKMGAIDFWLPPETRAHRAQLVRLMHGI